MPAITASHMIATFILIDSNGTFRAINSSSLLFPLLKLLIFLRLAAFTPLVSLLSTGEAHLGLTFIAFNHVLALDWTAAHVTITGRLWAPSQIRIKINHGVALEAPILIEQSLADTVLDIILAEFLRAARRHAAYIDDFALVNCSF